MDYSEALGYIKAAGRFGSKLGLENITNLMKELKNPEKKLRFIHVAGTNGKGSTSLFISEILREAGFKTGLYTSPFIYEFNERIKINGENISDSDFAHVTEKVVCAIAAMEEKGMEHPTEFELITAAAFLYFYEKKCDVVVLEVGLGGRFDATNVICPALSVITKIGIDHSEFLGNTFSEIAFEKCGIIKNGVPVVSSGEQPKEALNVIKKTAEEKNAHLTVCNIEKIEIEKCGIAGSDFIFEDEKYRLSQLGKYQIYNASVAICAARVLNTLGFKISVENIKNGLEYAKWHGRMEIISKNPLFLLDGSHNADGIDAFINTIKDVTENKRLICIFGMLKDKAYPYALKRLAEITDTVVLTEVNNPRSASVDELFSAAEGKFLNIYKEKDNKLATARAQKLAEYNDAIVAIGSLYMLSDIKNCFEKE